MSAVLFIDPLEPADSTRDALIGPRREFEASQRLDHLRLLVGEVAEQQAWGGRGSGPSGCGVADHGILGAHVPRLIREGAGGT